MGFSVDGVELRVYRALDMENCVGPLTPRKAFCECDGSGRQLLKMSMLGILYRD